MITIRPAIIQIFVNDNATPIELTTEEAAELYTKLGAVIGAPVNPPTLRGFPATGIVTGGLSNSQIGADALADPTPPGEPLS